MERLVFAELFDPAAGTQVRHVVKGQKEKLRPRFELGSLDSESSVITNYTNRAVHTLARLCTKLFLAVTDSDCRFQIAKAI